MLGVVLAVARLHAELPYPAYQHQSWSTADGLPQSSVHQILQSRDGYLWFATEGGAVRYNGTSFLVLQHATEPKFLSDDVSSLLEDPAGRIWFGTADGLLVRDGGKMRRFTEEQGLPSASVVGLRLSADGEVIAETAGGSAVLRGDSFQPWHAPEVASATMFDRDRTTVAQMHAAGPWRWSAELLQLSSGDSADSKAVMQWPAQRLARGARIHAVLRAERGAWVGTSVGLFYVDAQHAAVTEIPELHEESVLSLLRDAEGDIWVGTETSGVHVLRPRSIASVPVLMNREISCVAQASDGSMWVGTRRSGLHHLRWDAAAQHYNDTAIDTARTGEVVLSLAAGDAADMWVGTPEGLLHVSSAGALRSYTAFDGLPDNFIRSLLWTPDRTLWVGTRAGLVALRDGHVQPMASGGLVAASLIGPQAMTVDPQTRHAVLWAATLTGLARIDDGSVRIYDRGRGLTSDLITGIVPDGAGGVWVTTHDAGLYHIVADRFMRIAADVLPDELDSILWDERGALWMQGHAGLFMLSAKMLRECGTQRSCRWSVERFGVEDGLPSAELEARGLPASAALRDGTLWFATHRGIAMVDPAHLVRDRIPPPVVVESFAVDGRVWPTDAAELHLPSGAARYTFQCAALSFLSPAKVEYRYRLEGFDHGWSAATVSSVATYTNLSSGHYVFRAQAGVRDGVWNDLGAAVRFYVPPPFYRRWWFVLLCVLLLGLMVVVIYRLRIRSMQRRFELVLAERNRIAREIHDTLAQDFVGVSVQLDVIQQMLRSEQMEAARGQVQATRRIVQEGIAEARRSIWNLRASSTEETLPARLEALARRSERTDLQTMVQVTGAYRALPAATEKELLRIAQEAVTNALRHAAPKLIRVELHYTQTTVELSVADNGGGFDFAAHQERRGHYGLRGMRERAAAIGAVFEVHSRAGEGTTVRVVLHEP